MTRYCKLSQASGFEGIVHCARYYSDTDFLGEWTAPFHELLITGSSWREENLSQGFFSLQKEIMKMAEVLNKS